MNKRISKKSPDRIEDTVKILDELVPVLNEIHSIEGSQRFWGILIEEYIQFVLTLKKSLEENEIKQQPEVYPVNSDHIRGKKERAIDGLKRFVKYINTIYNFFSLKKMLKSGQSQFRIGFPELSGTQEGELGTNLPICYTYVFGKGESQKRKVANNIAVRCDDPFMKNVVRMIPTAYVEHFRSLMDKIPLYEPEKKIFHVHNLKTFIQRFLIAKYIENGARLFWYQHGSHYGEYQFEYMHYMEHLFADEFRTWGWKIKNKDVPWKAYRLEKFRNEYLKYDKTGEINLLLVYPKMYAKYIVHCESVTQYLCENLNFETHPKLLARPRPLHSKHGHEAELDFINHRNIQISSGLRPVAEEVSKSQLVIQIIVPGTNFLECIYSDHPVVGLLVNEQPTEQIKPFYDFLLQVGVLHENEKSLVSFLNNLNIAEWWESVLRKDTYKQFKKTFCNEV